jgi:hypothetical protein
VVWVWCMAFWCLLMERDGSWAGEGGNVIRMSPVFLHRHSEADHPAIGRERLTKLPNISNQHYLATLEAQSTSASAL